MKKVLLKTVAGVLSLGLLFQAQNVFAQFVQSATNPNQLSYRFKVIAYDKATGRGITSLTRHVGLQLQFSNESPFQVDQTVILQTNGLVYPTASLSDMKTIRTVVCKIPNLNTVIGLNQAPFSPNQSMVADLGADCPVDAAFVSQGILANLYFTVASQSIPTTKGLNYSYDTYVRNAVYLPND